MEQVQQSSSNRLLYLVCGGTILSVCGGLYYYLKSSSSGQSPSKFSNDEVMRVLKRFRRDYYPVYKYLGTAYKRAIQNVAAKFGFVPPNMKNSMYTLLVENNPKFKEQVNKLEDKVYSELGITDRRGFEAAANRLCQSNAQARKITEDIQNTIELICKGGTISLELPIAEHITPEVTFKVFKEISYTILSRLNEFMADYVGRNKTFDTFDPGFNKEVAEATRASELKSSLMREFRFDYSDVYHEHMVYDAAIKKYLKADPKYMSSVNQILKTERTLLDIHLNSEQDYTRLKGEIQKLRDIGSEPEQKGEEDKEDKEPQAEDKQDDQQPQEGAQEEQTQPAEKADIVEAVVGEDKEGGEPQDKSEAKVVPDDSHKGPESPSEKRADEGEECETKKKEEAKPSDEATKPEPVEDAPVTV